MSFSTRLFAQTHRTLSFFLPTIRPMSYMAIIAIVVISSFRIFADDMTGQAQLGVNTLSTQASSDIDNINLQNGNMSLQLPLASLPPVAGGKLSYTLNAYYNSALWKARKAEYTGEISGGGGGCPQTYTTTEVVTRDGGGWSIGGKYQIIFRDAHEDFDYVQPTDSYCGGSEFTYMDGAFFKPILKMPDGSEHEMRIDGSFATYGGAHEYLAGYYISQTGFLSNPFTSTARMYTVDGSFISVVYNSDGSYGIYLKDGTVVTPANGGQRISDTNGNSILLANSGGYDFAKDENTGRMIRWSASTYSGDPATKVEYQSVGGDWQSVNVVWGTTTVTGILYFHRDWNVYGGPLHFGGTCTDWSYLGDELPVVRSIVLPNTETSLSAQQFSFVYNSDSSGSVTDTSISMDCNTPGSVTRDASAGMGEISQITMPSGAVTNYSYKNDGIHKIGGSVDSSGENAVSDAITIKAVSHDGISSPDTWNYTIPPYSGGTDAGVTNPDGSTYAENSYTTNRLRQNLAGTSGLGGLAYRTLDRNRVMIERHWTLLGGTLYSFGSFSGGSNNKVTFNPVVDTEYTTLLDTDGTTRLKMTAKAFTYDYNGELLSTTEYDWINLGSVSYDSTTGVPTGIPGGTGILRVSNNSYYNTASTSSSSTAYHKRTLGSGSTVILGKPSETTVGTSSTVKSDTKFSYDGNSWGTVPTVGNLTKVRTFNDTTSSWIDTTTTTYGTYGNVTATTDGNGNTTCITYGSVGGYSNLYPTQVVQACGSGVARTLQTGYDFYTGLVTSVTDYDNSLTSITAYDIKLRPILVKNAYGTALENWIQTDYYDHDRLVVTKRDLVSINDAKKVATQFFDQLGRVRLSKLLENSSTQSATNETDGIKVETKYAYTSGYSWQLTSNPFRASSSSSAGSEETMGWTRSKQWATGRESQVETFSGATLPYPFLTSGYNTSSTGLVDTVIAAEATTVTDQASKVRRSLTDSLGRLGRVDEPTSSGLGSISSPNQATSYTYDVLNNLTAVSQGLQSRSFSYNSLSRLTSAANPESGTIGFVYDANGNLTSKTDARSIVTSYTYDALNRLTQRSYAAPSPTPLNYATTPTVTYTYDGQTYAKGKLTKVSSSVSATEYTAFDILGRATAHKQTMNVGGTNTDYSTTYTYSLAGELLTETYPSGRIVMNTFASNGDLSQVQTKPSGGSYTNRASNFVYNPIGAAQSLQLGNSKYETTRFNARLQPTQIGLGTSTTDTSLLKIEYGYGTTTNNGNVQSQTITVPGVTNTFNQAYIYDELNRLAIASEIYNGSQTWKQEFSFDRYGNRNFVTGSGHTTTLGSCTTLCNPTFSSTNNRITSSGYSYDSAGNTTAEPSGMSFTLDAENKQTQVTNGGAVGTYYYDGDGRRVKKTSTYGDDILFIYDANSKLIEERNLSGTLQTSYVYSGTRLLSTETEAISSTTYMTADQLGSPRINTDASGGVVARHDYLPYGEEILTIMTSQRVSVVGYVGDTTRNQFTGFQHDNETGMYFAEARYFAANIGRFSGPDPLPGKKGSPQTWNAYQYVHNNPINLVDPDGATGVPANIKTFVFKTLREMFGLAVRLNVSAGALMAISGYETGWGSSRAFKSNNPSGASIKEVPLKYPTLADGYTAWGNMLVKNYNDVLGITDPKGFLNAIQDNNGYKYNSVNNNYLTTIMGILTSNGLDFFDTSVLTPLRNGQSVTFGGVTVGSIKELNDYMTTSNTGMVYSFNYFISGIYSGWEESIKRKIADIGTVRDPNVAKIRSHFGLPGSSPSEEAETLHDDGISQFYELTRR